MVNTGSLDVYHWVDALCAAHAEILLPDLYTHSHQILTTPFVNQLGSKMGLSSEENRLLWLGARLHDIGKIGILDVLTTMRQHAIDKKSPIFARIQTHTLLGDRFFRALSTHVGHTELLIPLANIARWHHERIDGTGYPDRLYGYQIPLMVRIVSVLDSLSAMTGPDRPWRPSLPLNAARQELQRGRGTQFDALVVDQLDLVFQQSFPRSESP